MVTSLKTRCNSLLLPKQILWGAKLEGSPPDFRHALENTGSLIRMGFLRAVDKSNRSACHSKGQRVGRNSSAVVKQECAPFEAGGLKELILCGCSRSEGEK